VFRKKGVEVLLLSDRVDEWLVSHLHEYKGKHLQSVTKGKLDLGELADKEDQEKAEQAEKEHEDLLKRLKDSPRRAGQRGARLHPPGGLTRPASSSASTT
jgi:molecular chaperone HtpG